MKKFILCCMLPILLLTGCRGAPEAEPEAQLIGPVTSAPPAGTTARCTTVTAPETEPVFVPVPEPVQLGTVFTAMSDAEELDLSGIDVRGLDVDAFLSEMTGLVRINMKNCGLDNDEYAALQERHPNMRIIWNIQVKGYTIPTDAVGFSALLANEHQPRLTDDDTKYLKYCTDMVALDLGHHYISDLTFLAFMPKLRVLILVDNYAAAGSGARLSDISALQFVPHLRYLELFANNISDMSVLANLTELEDLNICYNPVSDAAPLCALPKLQRLWVYATYIPAADIAALCERYPEARIVTSGTGSVDQGWREGEHYNAMRNMVINNVIDEVYREE